MKGCLNVRGLTIQEVNKCVKDRRDWRRIVGGTWVIRSEAGCMKPLTLWII